MRLLRGAAAGFVLGALGGLALHNLRPAPLLAAAVGAVSADPPLAHVALRYGAGLAPAAVVVEVLAGDAALGSATISGSALFAEVRLSAVPDGAALRARVTLSYRVAGRAVSRVYQG